MRAVCKLSGGGALDGQVLGAEAGGVVVGCEDAKLVNQRVVFFDLGGFAEYSLVPMSRLVPVPDDVELPTALALTTMGLTAHYLCKSIGKLQPGNRVLVHAAGSGTGSLVAQVASNVFGCQVVGTCSPAKVGNVPLPPTQVVPSYTDVDRILASLGTGQDKFDVVFDGVGKDTFQTSLHCCKPRGLVCFFGNASGPVPLIDPLKDLNGNGSLFVTRPKLGDYVATHEELLERSKEVFTWLESGQLKLAAPKVFDKLDSVQEALEYVKQRKATSKVVIRI
ncbi:hypothetical protein BASA81_000794 [Batrachochytrium salamandrivorans]|nr:hypothetical protein BASA81_000794 [Batrachochytrium salamandrivorans]